MSAAGSPAEGSDFAADLAAGFGEGDDDGDPSIAVLRRPGILTVSSAPTDTSAISESFETRSPFLTLTSFTTPATVAGTSIVALSVSSVMSGDSGSIRSPGLTSTSMTSTS